MGTADRARCTMSEPAPAPADSLSVLGTEEWWKDLAVTVFGNLGDALLLLVWALFLVLIAWIIIKIICWLIKRAIRRTKVDEVVTDFVVGTIKFFLWMIALIQIMTTLNITLLSATTL